MSRRSRLVLTLLVSVLLHAALLAALSRVPAAVSPGRRTAEAVELELVYQPEKPTAPAAPAQPPARASAAPERRVERQPEPLPGTPKAGAPAVGPLAGDGARDAPSQPSGSKPLAEDVPRAPPSLLPKDPLGGLALGGTASTGRTVRNVPGSEPDPKAVAAQQAEEARERVDGWARDTLASARAESGAVGPYFAELQDGFAAKLVNPPPPNLKILAERMKREQVEAIQRFGKTGSPYAPEKRDHRLEQRNRLQAAVEAGRAANMYMVDVTAPVLALAAVVEVRQARDGKLLDLKVLEGSGDPTFDAWAVSQLRDALASAEAPPDAGVGIHDGGMRTRWRLEEYLGVPRVQVRLIGVY